APAAEPLVSANASSRTLLIIAVFSGLFCLRLPHSNGKPPHRSNIKETGKPWPLICDVWGRFDQGRTDKQRTLYLASIGAHLDQQSIETTLYSVSAAPPA